MNELDGMNLKELKTLADSFDGFRYPVNIGEKTLKKNMEKFISNNPDCLGSDTEDEVEPEVEDEIETEKEVEVKPPVVETPKQETLLENALIKMKCKNPGTRNTSEGVIVVDSEGFAEVTEKQAVLLESIPGYDRC